MRFVDMFCGMGTIRMGFEKAGHECVYSVEWDKHKRKIYEVIFGHEPEASDITSVRGSDIPISDCWCFGAPCQDFSIAGIRAGLNGDRSSLVREVFRLVRETSEEHRPEWLLYENVKGMLSSNKGLDYLEILFEMASLGYDVEWQMLNSCNFGIRQSRERVFTLGHKRGKCQQKIFPIRAKSFESGKSRDFGKWFIHDKRQSNETRIYKSVCPTVTTFWGLGGNNVCLVVDKGKLRRLTPRECMRLQGVPDYITDRLIAAEISDTQMYRAAGDACTVPVINAIASKLQTFKDCK